MYCLVKDVYSTVSNNQGNEMLILHDGSPNYKNLTLANKKTLPPNVTWIDLIQGTAEEIAAVESVIGRRVPTLAELQEIENSSRLRADRGALCMSAPLIARNNDDLPCVTPVGFILTGNYLVTVRFAEMSAFSSFASDYAEENEQKSGIGVFAGLIDAIIDRAADVLEQTGGDLDTLSRRIFGHEEIGKPVKAPAKETASLQEVVRKIGRNADLSSKIRDSLLGIGRIVSFAAGMGKETHSPELRAHLETQRNDIVSLSDYEGHLANKIQLLLDATMGLINIEQNNIIKVLTVVSVVGVPPTLIASMYGMNFHTMPELSWTYGYAYALALIVVSAILPLIWFKKRGWL